MGTVTRAIAVASDNGIDQDISIKMLVEVCPACGYKARVDDIIELHVVLEKMAEPYSVVYHNPHRDDYHVCAVAQGL